MNSRFCRGTIDIVDCIVLSHVHPTKCTSKCCKTLADRTPNSREQQSRHQERPSSCIVASADACDRERKGLTPTHPQSSLVPLSPSSIHSPVNPRPPPARASGSLAVCLLSSAGGVRDTLPRASFSQVGERGGGPVGRSGAYHSHCQRPLWPPARHRAFIALHTEPRSGRPPTRPGARGTESLIAVLVPDNGLVPDTCQQRMALQTPVAEDAPTEKKRVSIAHGLFVRPVTTVWAWSYRTPQQTS